MHSGHELLQHLPLLALYPEIHFRFFRLFPSFLFQKQPEILFDLPRRLGPGRDLPVALIANDCGRFPARFSDCSIAVSAPKTGGPRLFDFPDLAKFEVRHPFSNSLKCWLLSIPRKDLFEGMNFINARVSVASGRKKSVVLNDNLRTTSKLPFSCYCSGEQLPGGSLCRYGDLHVHSAYSQSHVEFGPPLAVIDAVAAASGLSFTAITDHSYDLACSPDDYLRPDPSLGRWRLFLSEINGSAFETTLVPGEEISCLNARKEVVHLCALAAREFVPGNLDGARKGRRKDPQDAVPDAVGRIHGSGGIAVAAHPGGRAGFMQRLFLFRGEWSVNDLRNGLDAMQIFNNGFSPMFERGKALWISLLKSGMQVPAVAGNDAHGDFNRYRAIAVPFFEISDNRMRFMGKGKTGLYGHPRSIPEIIGAIKSGRTFLTTGPFASIGKSGVAADSIVSHEAIPRDREPLFVHALSTQEFGPLRKIAVFAGGPGPAAETTVLTRVYGGNDFSSCEKIDPAVLPDSVLYLRAEAHCSTAPGEPSSAFTSPVYFQKR